jgi:hypothetical protein
MHYTPLISYYCFPAGRYGSQVGRGGRPKDAGSSDGLNSYCTVLCAALYRARDREKDGRKMGERGTEK